MAFSGDISYNPEKLQGLAGDVGKFYESAVTTHGDVKQSINKISASWEGDNANEGIGELQKVEESLEAIENNAKEAKELMENVANNFEGIRY